ncbi:RNase E specificity factor CsrD [Biostraticola tofi]|uniref:Diguanylate cyclase/phosphodiesterase n=1 Tax=Biostraticola tofi TaxID=466109 RepID=A0A4R3YUC0_9GAMM|nr:RNase E specificity factor CsrD [Biostraticola tofi]TCV96587.1 diguanylate cyclase/phosphodiesterase [Biostraticola tofi]
MRLTIKLSAMVAMMCSLAMLLMLAGSALSFFYLEKQRIDNQMASLSTLMDQVLLTEPPHSVEHWLPMITRSAGMTGIDLSSGGSTLYRFSLADEGGADDRAQEYRHRHLMLLHHPDIKLTVMYQDLFSAENRSTITTLPISLVILLMVTALVVSLRWLKRQIQPQENLEYRARRIIYGERDPVGKAAEEWPSLTANAIDRLLKDLADAREQRSRVDILIRAFAARDAKTGLSNRLFFDNQLSLQLEENQETGNQGAVMMIRPPDREGKDALAADTEKWLINLISSLAMRYPGALLARYFHDDVAVLLPNRSLKDARTMAGQLINGLNALPSRARHDVLHIGICLYRPGQTVVEVMETAEQATRSAALQGGNTWAMYDSRVPEAVRGHVKWRTLLEHTLNTGGPQHFIRESFKQDGSVDHHVVVNRIIDGAHQLTAAEFLPVMQQLGLAARYEQQLLTRIVSQLGQLPGKMAVAISVHSLLQRQFQLWLRNLLMQCEKMQRKQIMFELVEADLCQHLGRLRPALRLLSALGCDIAVVDAGRTLVSTAYIAVTPVSVIKLHPGLVRGIERRSENQLFMQSLLEACIGSSTRIFATGVKTNLEWQTLLDNAVAGGEGDFFAPIQPFDRWLKKYSLDVTRLV